MYRRLQSLDPPIKLAISMIFLGALFVIMHWPYGRLIMSGGLAATFLLYPFRFAKKDPKRLIDYVKLVLVCSWSLDSILSINHLPYKEIPDVVSGISFLIWLVMEVIDYFGSPRDNDAKVRPGPVLFGIAVVFILMGSALSIMHWPGAGIFLVLGFIAAIGWMLSDLNVK